MLVRISFRWLEPDSGMLSSDKEVKRAREHRPLSRGSRTAPSPTRVVLWSGPCRAYCGTGPALSGSIRAAVLLFWQALPSFGLRGHRRRRIHRIEPRRRADRARRPRRGDRQPLHAASARTSRARWPAAPSSTRSTCATPVAISDIFAASGPQLVFHLAAQIDVRHSVEDPDRRRQVNVLGTIAVLRGRAGDRQRRRVVNSSTGGGLYGDADVLPTPEDYPIRPLAPVRAGQATPPRATASCTRACTGSRPSRCATATSTGRARTSTARPAWSRSSAGA